MKLNQYQKYKETGIQWIGKIPEEWEVHRLKYVLVPEPGKNVPEGEEDYVEIGDINRETKDYVKTSKLTVSGAKNVPKGTILISTVRPNLRGITITKERINVSSAFCKLKLDNPYSFFYLTNDSFFSYLFTKSTGSTYPTCKDEDIFNYPYMEPSLEEKNCISSFLDTKTTQINTIIEKDKKLIELLKEKRTALINHVVTKGLNPKARMKDSEIEWIGEVPKNSKVMPFRRICRLNQGLQFPQDERLELPEKNSFLYITIKYLNSEEKIEEYIPNPPKSVICKKDDVLLARTGATGEVITNQEGVFHNNFFKINYDPKINRDYLVYYLQKDSVKKILLLKAGTTTIPDLNHDDFLDIPFIYRDYNEQQKISLFLDKATSKIDQTIKKIEQKIKLMEEYKKSLIYHVVTGKVDVRAK